MSAQRYREAKDKHELALHFAYHLRSAVGLLQDIQKHYGSTVVGEPCEWTREDQYNFCTIELKVRKWHAAAETALDDAVVELMAQAARQGAGLGSTVDTYEPLPTEMLIEKCDEIARELLGGKHE